MNIKTITERYLGELEHLYRESVRTRQMTPELSYRPILDVFFHESIQPIEPLAGRIFEPTKQSSSGRPDWRFYNSRNLGVYGYVEAKPFNPTLPLDPNSFVGQIDKYRRLEQAVILTDGIDFFFYYPSGERTKISIADKPLNARHTWAPGRGVDLLEQELRKFFTKPSSRKVSESKLIEECALRAQLLAEEIETLCSAPRGSGITTGENKTIDTLHDLKQLVSRHHDPMMREPKFFADFVAQVLVFGMIYVHRVLGASETDPRKKFDTLKVFWKIHGLKRDIEQLRPFCALGRQLEQELGTLGALGTWFEDCALMLSYVQLEEAQETSPDFHKLFETFLGKFDPKTRFDYGAFYTPPELASYMVRLVEEVAKKDFPEVELYDERNKLMDPCCGTGSFLEHLFLAAAASNSKPTIIGFEILPAPYALAHYRMAMIADTDPKNVRIVLTNTLSDDLETRPRQSQLGMLEREQQEARDLARPPLTLIIGNPPSSDSFHASQGDNFSIVQELLNDFRPPSTDRSGRQNVQKQVQNEHMKFLRWSSNKIMESSKGILALVLPSSFLESPSYKFARKWLTENFSHFYVLEVDLDARSGVRASSIFNTLQGRAVLIATRTNETNQTKPASFRFATIADFQRRDKLAHILDASNEPKNILREFTEFTPSEQSYNFKPSGIYDQRKYSGYWALFQDESTENYIFQRHCSGLKLAPSALFVHSVKELLQRRSQDIANLKKSVADIIQQWYSGQDKPPNPSKLGDSIRTEFRSLVQNEAPRRYAYRPFLNTWALLSENLLHKLSSFGGGGTRYRPEVLSAFQNEDTIGIAVAPSRKDIGEHLHRFVSFCWFLPDNDLCLRGNAHVFCNQFPGYKKGRSTWDSAPKNNVNPHILESLNISPDDVVFYSYAVLCSSAYLDEFESALFTGSDSELQPRIPITEDREVFLRLSGKGRRLANMEKPTTPTADQLDDWTKELFEEVEPGFRLFRFELDNENESISLIDPTSKVVVELKPVPAEVLNYHVGGYQVIQQWLKFHSNRYTRAEFTSENLIEFLMLLQNIKAQIELIRGIDEDVKLIMSR